MELKKTLKVTLSPLISIRKGQSTLPLSFSFSIYHEFGLDLGLSSWMFSAYLEKSFCEVYDKQYGDVQMII